MNTTRPIRIAIGLIVTGLILPSLLVAVLLASIPSISPSEAEKQLQDPKQKAILVDVRPEQEFNAFSLRSARNIPIEEALSDQSAAVESLKGANKILVICDTGFDGAWATRRLLRKGYRNVVNVAGGMDAWLTDRSGIDRTVRTLQGEDRGVSLFAAPLLDQVMIIVTAFGLKPLYQIVSVVIIILLWRRTNTDLTAIKWAMLAFVIGENACAANYLVFHEGSLLMEYLHMYGMLLCFGLVVYAVMDAVDKRVLHFTDRDRHCVLQPQCGTCYKYQNVRCNLRSFSLLVIPATMVLAAIPLTGSVGHRLHEGAIFGNAAVFGQPVMYQYLEARVFPVLALCFFPVALIVLLRWKEDGFVAAKLWYSMGMGLLGFSLMRFFFYWGYQDRPLWADVWEEITEFLFIAVILWIALRVRAASRQSGQVGTMTNSV